MNILIRASVIAIFATGFIVHDGVAATNESVGGRLPQGVTNTIGCALKIVSPTNVFELGQPIRFNLCLTNTSTNDILFKVWDGYGNYRINVKAQSGQGIPATTGGAQLLNAAGRFHDFLEKVSPARSFDVPLPLHDLFNFKEAGTYTLEASREVLGKNAENQPVWVKAEPFKFRIENPKR